MKSTRVDCGLYSFGNTDTELAQDLFGSPGTQAGRRWFYRLLDGPDWRRKGRRSSMKLILYFRTSTDATFFCLKKMQK
jgi:hypothetical protein